MEITGLDKQHSVSVMAKKEAVAAFQEKMRKAGIVAHVLEVTEVKPSLHERAEGIRILPIYLISWRKEPVKLFGLWTVPGTDRASGKFIKLPPARINLPPEATQQYDAIGGIAEIEESAVFLSTRLADSHLALILAVRVVDQWFDLHRWSASWRELGISRPEVCQG